MGNSAWKGHQGGQPPHPSHVARTAWHPCLLGTWWCWYACTYMYIFLISCLETPHTLTRTPTLTRTHTLTHSHTHVPTGHWPFVLLSSLQTLFPGCNKPHQLACRQPHFCALCIYHADTSPPPPPRAAVKCVNLSIISLYVFIFPPHNCPWSVKSARLVLG